MPPLEGPAPDDSLMDLGNGLGMLAGLYGSGPPQASTMTQMAQPEGGLAQDIGVAAVPGGVGNVAAPGVSQATGAGGIPTMMSRRPMFSQWLRGLFG